MRRTRSIMGRRVSAALFAAVLALSVAACGNQDKEPKESGSSQTESGSPQQTQKESENKPLEAAVLAESYKNLNEGNPIVTQRYSADPGVMVYDDTVYVYSTNDIFEYQAGLMKENNYGTIKTINCFSSKDLVNWTDHGTIPVAGDKGIATWAANSWAPCAAHKTIDGKERFFLYFANSAGGIGVLESDSPTGPWVDPIGRAMITTATPNCGNVVWMFDPAVLVDDDGKAYIYFGGGVPEGEPAHPKTIRAAQLGDDMISLATTPVEIDAPYLFEDSGITKIGDKYYFSYCSNFSTGGSEYNSGAIQLMVSDNPLGPFTYHKELFANPGAFSCFSTEDGGSGGNNHHSFFEFKGKYYLAYHTRTLELAELKKTLGYRSTHIDEVTVVDGDPQPLKPTSKEGPAQLVNLNPYDTVRAATMAVQGGVLVTGEGDTIVAGIADGDWTGVKGVDFGDGASAISVSVSLCNDTYVEIHAGSPDGDLLGTIEIAKTGSTPASFQTEVTGAKGVMDIYFVFRGNMKFETWQAYK